MSLHPETCLFANPSSSNAWIKIFTFVLYCGSFLSLLLCRWWFAVCTLWLQCETWVSVVLAGYSSNNQTFSIFRNSRIDSRDAFRFSFFVMGWKFEYKVYRQTDFIAGHAQRKDYDDHSLFFKQYALVLEKASKQV